MSDDEEDVIEVQGRSGGRRSKTPAKHPKKTAGERRAEQPMSEEDLIDSEVVHGDLIHHEDGSIEVVNPVTPNRTLTTRERQRQAITLRMMGVSYQTIADQLGYASASGAYQAVQTGSKEGLKDSAIDLRNLSFMRLETLKMVYWPKAVKGDAQALAAVLGIEDRQRALMGLDGLPVGDTEEETEGVLRIGKSKDQYIEGLKKMRQGQLPQ